MKNLWALRLRLLKNLICAQKGSFAIIIANSNKRTRAGSWNRTCAFVDLCRMSFEGIKPRRNYYQHPGLGSRYLNAVLCFQAQSHRQNHRLMGMVVMAVKFHPTCNPDDNHCFHSSEINDETWWPLILKHQRLSPAPAASNIILQYPFPNIRSMSLIEVPCPTCSWCNPIRGDVGD